MRTPAASVIACCLLLLSTASVTDARQAGDPFERGRVSVEFGFSGMTELWNLNEQRESLVEVTAAFWGAVGKGVSLGVEFGHLRVFQPTTDALVQGFSPLVRWRCVEAGAWNVFVEGGPGISWSDLPTPPRGTKFNYLAQVSGGAMRRVGASGQLVMGVRLLHLSNNHREGRDRNPDFEMLGPFVGFAFLF